ncbi:type 1 glutamine amidotransferase [Sphingomonas sp. ac-8]|uniref:type 1 glutamine amidotransferase n=1 Tax=Sphingomonas sp. ac-8 TaxID=3242977 RepID=UPI003A80A9DB
MSQLRLLVAESAPPSSREERRRSAGQSQGESYLDALRAVVPGATLDQIFPADDGEVLPDRDALAGYDGIFLTGSPLHLYDDKPEVRRLVDFMRDVFDSGTPSFGSCAGLQLAVVAAGGSVRSMGDGREAGFARRVTACAGAADHPLLDGRPPAFDVPAIYSDQVERLPEGATAIAGNSVTPVLAAEIRCGEGIFWGVQYHPELSLREVAAALRREGDELIEQGFAADRAALDAHADRIDALHRAPDRRDLAWQLGLDDQVTDPDKRRRELANFVAHRVRPIRAARGRE